MDFWEPQVQRAPWISITVDLGNCLNKKHEYTELPSFHFIFNLAFEDLKRRQPHKNKTGNENETDFWHCVSRKENKPRVEDKLFGLGLNRT